MPPTKVIRIDTDVLEELRKKSDGRGTPNQAIRQILGLPERKHSHKGPPTGHISRAGKYLLKAFGELEQERRKQ